MRRRTFTGLLGVASAYPLAAPAQQPGRTYRLGYVTPQARGASQYVALVEGLARLGFVEGKNLLIDEQGFNLKPDQYAVHARELADAKVDLIAVGSGAPTRVVQQTIKTVPIITIADDMVGEGIVQSIARPGGNATGLSLLASELDGKRQEILIELLPGIKRLAVLADSLTSSPTKLQALEAAGRAQGIDVMIHRIGAPAEIGPAVDAAKAGGAQGLNVLASVTLFIGRKVIFERTAALGLPAIYQWPEYVDEGAFAGYGPRLSKLYRDQMAPIAAAIFNGAKPADVPVRQPTNFELAINLKTAKALGITVPRPLLVRADEVTE